MTHLQDFQKGIFKLIIFCLFPLMAGAIIYLLFRSDSLVVFGWIDLLGLKSDVEKMREFFSPLSRLIPKQVLFSVPDALWTFSLAWFLEVIWNESNDRRITRQVFSISLIISLGYEFFQYFYRSLGWFCFYDVAWIMIALFAFKVTARIHND
jgi:hypothetical protein